ADPSHPQQTYRAWNIVEGNLVVQDGVSPQAHISSQTLAEIVAHEFGHTLGFGHSADNTALMYATVTGLGPSLRPDDQTAARWLYPNGASTPPPPPPPTQQPVSAAFSMTPSSGIAGQTTFTFADQSTGPVASRMWNLGDGTTSTAASLSHVYSTPGAYTVSLTVSGNGTQSQATRVATVNSNQPALTAAFAYSPSSPLAGDPVAFSDGSTGGVTSWVWNFGDGTASSVQNPVKTYANAGSYNVTLTVYRNAESKVSVQTISVGTKIPATPQAGPFASLVPVTAQTNGANGSIWRTELTLFNAGPETANVNLTFVPGAGVPAQVRAIAVLPRETRTYANALRDIFGMPAGAGGISIQATSATTTPDLRIASRTFAATTNGTYGQAVPDVASSDLQSTTYLTGIISTNDFRTNIGLVNKSGNTVVAALSLFDANGGNVENINLTIPPNSFQQGSLAGYFASTSGRSLPLLSLRIATTNRDALSAYASVVDNKTQDPVYIQAVPLPGNGPVTVPVVGRTNGANGTFWRSDVTLFNPNSVTSNVTLTYRSSTATRSRSFGLTPNNSATIADLITWMGESAGSGMLEVTWNGGAPVVTSRTYTTDGNGGTFGQSVDPVGGFNRQQYVTGLRSDIDFRTNVGFVNGGNAPVNVGIVVLSASGAQIGSGSITLAPRSQAQYPLSAFVQSVNQNSIGSCTLQAQTDGASTLFVYGSVVDNASGDPVLFAGN
ncbi:MAG TPA: PKD domain-containing protein, partial [Thermoanaerobaculia bacterium]